MSSPLYDDLPGYNNVQDNYQVPTYERVSEPMPVPEPQVPVDQYDPLGFNETFIGIAMAEQFVHMNNPLTETIRMEERAQMNLETLMHLDHY